MGLGNVRIEFCCVYQPIRIDVIVFILSIISLYHISTRLACFTFMNHDHNNLSILQNQAGLGNFRIDFCCAGWNCCDSVYSLYHKFVPYLNKISMLYVRLLHNHNNLSILQIQVGLGNTGIEFCCVDLDRCDSVYFSVA